MSTKYTKTIKTIKNTPNIKQIREQKQKEYREQQIHIPWIEKYRPKRIKNLLTNKILKLEIDKILKYKDIPNMILTGISGIGKTSTILCLAYELYEKYMSSCVLELNASDDRGIKSLNTAVINFCDKMLPYDSSIKLYAQHKLLIFDEADNMTEKAQLLICNLMDKYHSRVRFVFTCNTSTTISESIQTRCKILRYEKIDPPQVIERLKFICDREKLIYNEDGLMEVYNFSNGDLRHAINILQMAKTKYNKLNSEIVYDITDRPQLYVIKDLIKLFVDKNLKESLNLVYTLKNSGFSCCDILSIIFSVVKSYNYTDLSEDSKMTILLITTNYLYDVNRFVDTDLQLTNYIIDMCSAHIV